MGESGHMKSDDGVHAVIKGRTGTARMPAPPGGAVAELIRASAYNTVRRRSDPVEARVGGSE